MTKASRWAWIVSAFAATGAGLVLAFLLSIATNNPTLYERHYVWLFWVNVTVAAVLVLVIGAAGVRLLVRVRRGKFGSRLLLKLAAIFALVGVVPGVLIYTVSYQFVSRSIESWFDIKVETALDAGLKLGKGTLDAVVSDVAAKTRLAAERLGDTPGAAQPLALERLREQLAAQEIAIVGPAGQTVLTTGGTSARLMPERPALAVLRQARNARVVSELAGLDEDTASSTAGGTGGTSAATSGTTSGATSGATSSGGAARVRAVAVIPTATFTLGEEDRYLVVTQLLPPTLAANALAVQAAYREYQQRALALGGLRKMYIGTLTLALVLAVFGALLLAVALSNQLAQPLLLLADGMRQVAEGDLSSKPVFASRDELGGLTRSFADMTTQLAEARALAQRSVVQVEGARTNLQTILDNLSAGVIVFDRAGRIDTVNPGATRIMRLPLSAYRGQRLTDVPPRSVRAGRGPALRAAPHQPRGRRAGPVARLVRPADAHAGRAGPRFDHAAGARRLDAERRAADGLRRHHRARLGAAQRGLERSGTAPGARDQKPADADPVVGRAAAAQARAEARRR